MPEYVEVAKESEVADGQGKVVEANGKEIALFKVGGKFFALDNTCPHSGGPLGEGELEGKIVSCPWHGWQFDVESGQNQFDKSLFQPRFNVKVEDGKVFVEV